jgi:hypothetical protein
MSAEYAVMTAVIETNNKGIKADYDDRGERLLWPKVIGLTNGKERVLCTELEEYPVGSGRYRQKHWRCFAVEDLEVSLDDTFVVERDDRPEKWKVKHLRKQSCVEDIDVFR